MARRFISILLPLLLLLIMGCHTQRSLVKDGTFVLSADDLAKSEPLQLRGLWAFQYGEYHNSIQLLQGRIPVPASWSWKDTGSQGFGTYGVKVLLPPGWKLPLGLKVPVIGSSYRLMVNGTMVLSRGNPGDSRSTTQGDYGCDAAVLTPDLWGTSGTLDMVFQVANFHDQFGGMGRAPLIGNVKAVADQAQGSAVIEAAIAFSALVLGLYFLIFSFFRDKNHVLIFFGLFCLCVGLRSLCYGEVLIQILFPGIPWDPVIRGVYLFLALGILCFSWYIHNLYPKHSSIQVPWAVTILIGIYFPLTILAPVEVFTLAVVPLQCLTIGIALYSLWVILKALMQKESGAMTLFIGFGIFIMTLIYDIIVSDFFPFLPGLVGFGLLGLLFYQAVLVGRSFSRAFGDLEVTYKELKRTQESLVQSEKMAGLGVLVASVAHEVNNPIAAISSSLGTLELNWDKACGLWNNLAGSITATDMDLWRRLWELIKPDSLMWHQEEALREHWTKVLSSKSLDPSVSWKLAAMISCLGVDHMDEGLLARLISGRGPQVLELLSSGCQVRRSVGTIKSSVERTTRLVKGLNLYSKASQFREPQDIDLWESWKGVLTQWPHLESQGVKLETRCEANLPMVRGIPEELAQIWSNLLQNSLHALNGGGRILITASREGEGILSEIWDSGPGIPMDVINRIFEPFFTTKPLGEGTGLGLAIVKQLVEKLGGWIEAVNPPGGGALFRVWVPGKGV